MPNRYGKPISASGVKRLSGGPPKNIAFVNRPKKTQGGGRWIVVRGEVGSVKMPRRKSWEFLATDDERFDCLACALAIDAGES
jgi:hypothetical protein